MPEVVEPEVHGSRILTLFLHLLYLLTLLIQLFLLVVCLGLSELPLQNVAGVMGLISFMAHLMCVTRPYLKTGHVFKPKRQLSNDTSSSSSSFYHLYWWWPLIETLLITAFLNFLCLVKNTKDVIQPFSGWLWWTELWSGTLNFMLVLDMLRLAKETRNQRGRSDGRRRGNTSPASSMSSSSNNPRSLS